MKSTAATNYGLSLSVSLQVILPTDTDQTPLVGSVSFAPLPVNYQRFSQSALRKSTDSPPVTPLRLLRAASSSSGSSRSSFICVSFMWRPPATKYVKTCLVCLPLATTTRPGHNNTPTNAMMLITGCDDDNRRHQPLWGISVGQGEGEGASICGPVFGPSGLKAEAGLALNVIYVPVHNRAILIPKELAHDLIAATVLATDPFTRTASRPASAPARAPALSPLLNAPGQPPEPGRKSMSPSLNANFNYLHKSGAQICHKATTSSPSPSEESGDALLSSAALPPPSEGLPVRGTHSPAKNIVQFRISVPVPVPVPLPSASGSGSCLALPRFYYYFLSGQTGRAII